MHFLWENAVEVPHGYVIKVKLLSEQLVFAKLDHASVLRQRYLFAITTNVTSPLGQSEATLENELRGYAQ